MKQSFTVDVHGPAGNGRLELANDIRNSLREQYHVSGFRALSSRLRFVVTARVTEPDPGDSKNEK